MDPVLHRSLEWLSRKRAPLFLTTSNRWSGEKGGEMPKSTALAYHMAHALPAARVIEVPRLSIHPCEGNVSTARGNTCGLREAALDDPAKNPTGHHRCWASLNNPDDELWKVSQALLSSDSVVFFGSVRWGQLNATYQKLIERLTWLENRHSALGEDNLLASIDAGLIVTGHNWNAENALAIQKQVLRYFGFRVVDDLCWSWSYTSDAADEGDASYRQAAIAFRERFLDADGQSRMMP